MANVAYQLAYTTSALVAGLIVGYIGYKRSGMGYLMYGERFGFKKTDATKSIEREERKIKWANERLHELDF